MTPVLIVIAVAAALAGLAVKEAPERSPQRAKHDSN